jgi:hypothetical protein
MEAINLFNDINLEDFNIDVCCICLEDMVDNIHTLKCNHRFHSECIIETFRSGLTDCPLCRQKAPARNPYMHIGHLKFKLLKSYTKKKNANKNILELFEKYKKLEESIKEYRMQTKLLKREFSDFKKTNEEILKTKIKFQKDIKDIKYTRRFGRGLGRIACTEKLNEILEQEKQFLIYHSDTMKLEKKYIKEIANFYNKTNSGYSELYRLKTLIESIPIVPLQIKN